MQRALLLSAALVLHSYQAPEPAPAPEPQPKPVRCTQSEDAYEWVSVTCAYGDRDCLGNVVERPRRSDPNAPLSAAEFALSQEPSVISAMLWSVAMPTADGEDRPCVAPGAPAFRAANGDQLAPRDPDLDTEE